MRASKDERPGCCSGAVALRGSLTRAPQGDGDGWLPVALSQTAGVRANCSCVVWAKALAPCPPFLLAEQRWARFALPTLPSTAGALASILVALEPQNRRALADRDQARVGIDIQLGAGVGDVEVAHGELADAVGRREGCVLHLFHAQPLRLIGQVGTLGVEQRIVVAAAQLERDLAGDGARHPALRGFAQHQGLGIEPAALVEQSAEAQAVDAVLLDGVLVVDA